MGFRIVLVMKPRERKKWSQHLRGRSFRFAKFEMVPKSNLLFCFRFEKFQILGEDINMQIILDFGFEK